MKGLAMTGGILGILISLTAQLFAVIDDSYTFGNIGFLGIICGIIGVIGAFQIGKNKTLATTLLVVSSFVGFYAIAAFYIIPAILMLIPALLIQKRV
ncbi:hypothetical protein [Bacillus seohaeanensis]|jgi:hypothetical protein|uniref:DUF4064 domain-containing protein n=1 Tax=Bacillus seohaeanensis TaxID=284580 RepID=A0ABW5RQX5_9BACI